MAQKVKIKAKDIYLSEKDVKNKDLNKKRTLSDKSSKDYTGIHFRRILKIIFVLWILIKISMGFYGAYKAYQYFTAVPDLPALDTEVWWTNTARETQDTSIRRFRPMFTEAMKEELRRKFDLYRINPLKRKSLNESWSYGTNSEALGVLYGHWQYNYVYRERERYINKFEHFKTNIQGLDIHFVHVKPKVDKNVKVLPLLLLHGWPSTFRDFFEAIPLLTTPRSGYNFVFEVIVPSLPGFIYSQAPELPGMGPREIAVVMDNLMNRLGFNSFYIHGEDFGHTTGSHMATYFGKHVLGFHTTFPVNFSKLSILTWILGDLWPSFVGEDLAEKMYPLKDKIEFLLEESGYMHLQGTKPDTIGVALSDSPVGLLSYITDRLMVFTDPANKYREDGGLTKHYSMTNIVDNVMLYWVTNSITTAIRLYRESFYSSWEKILAEIPTDVPTWGLRTSNELIHQPDFMVRWKYPNLVGTTNLDFGGHFAAFENPKDVADDLFLSVQRFRKL